jgi:hypothetical protein
MTYVSPDSEILYLTSLTKSGIATYLDLQKPPMTASVEVESTQAVASSDGEVLVKAFVSPALGIEEMPSGNFIFNIYGAVDAAAGASELVGRIYQRTLAGVETEKFYFTTGEINNLTATLFAVTESTTDFVTSITDRLVLKIYAKTDNATNITLSLFYMGDPHQSRFAMPVNITKVTGGDMIAALYDPDYDGITTSSTDSGGGHTIQDAGAAMTQRSNLNFIGATVTDDAGNDATKITITGAGHTIQDESTDLPNETYLNFTGAGIIAYDTSSDTATDIEVDFNVHSNEIVSGKTLTIDAGTTAVVGGPLTISGDLVLNGSIVIL